MCIFPVLPLSFGYINATMNLYLIFMVSQDFDILSKETGICYVRK